MNYELYRITYEINGWTFVTEIYALNEGEAIRRADRTVLRKKGRKVGKIVSVEKIGGLYGGTEWYMHYSGFNPVYVTERAQENEGQGIELTSYNNYSTMYVSSGTSYITNETILNSNNYLYVASSTITGA